MALPRPRRTLTTTILTGGLALAVAVASTACGSSTPVPTATSDTGAVAPGSTAGSTTTALAGTATSSTRPATGTGTPPSTAPSGGGVTFAPGKHTISLDVGGTKRTAVAVVPANLAAPAPLVYAFHGHGGNGANFDKKMDIEGNWPEAIVLYPDGLVGHKGITDPEGLKPGWQTLPGEDGDRDLAFYDALDAAVHAALPVDDTRIYVLGHSNGSAFTSLLLNVRGDHIAATANMSAQPGKYLETDPVRSMFLSMGEQDPIVPYQNQVKSIPLAEQHLGVDTAHPTVDGYLKIEQGTNGIELDTYVHPAGHEVPDAVPPLVVSFLKRQHL